MAKQLARVVNRSEADALRSMDVSLQVVTCQQYACGPYSEVRFP